VLLASGLVATEGKTEEVAGKTGACKTTPAAGGVGSDGSKTLPTAANVGFKRLAGPSAASGVATWSSEASAKLFVVDGASSEDLRLDYGFLAPLLGEELPEVLAESAIVVTLAAFLLLEILNAADIIGKIVLITEYRSKACNCKTDLTKVSYTTWSDPLRTAAPMCGYARVRAVRKQP
jgi:hypothetical protein